MSKIETYISLGIVKNANGDVLIIERAKEERGTGNIKLSWAFPGGKRENESEKQAAEREVLEETGYKVKAKEIISERQHPQFPVYVYYIQCEMEDEKQISKPQDGEIKQVKWVRPAELSKYLTTDLDPRVASYIGL